MTLYDLLRLLGFNRRKIIAKTLEEIERDEKAARQRMIDAARKAREQTESN